MKKILSLTSFVALAACAGVDSNVSDLNRLNTEPKNCEFLYTLDSTVLNYNKSDAYEFVEKQILEHETNADSYYVISSKEIENEGAIFGPKYTYKMKVKVYNCNK